MTQAAASRLQSFQSRKSTDGWERYKDDPVGFAWDVTGTKLWQRQAEALRAVSEHKFVAVRSGHKVGKSRLDALAALWWVCTRTGARVVFTAPAGHQVEDILWPELRRLYWAAGKSAHPIGGRLYEDYHKGLKLGDGREIIGLTTRDTEAFGGISAPELLFIVDEASGFPEKIFEAVFGNSMGGGKVLLTGNPTRPSGTFFDAFHSKRHAWHGMRISSRETPNFTEGAERIPGLASPEGVAQLEEHYGKGSPILDIRVEGNFPRQGACSVVALALVEDAASRWMDTRALALPDDPLVVGLDCGRFGDDPSVAALRRGKRAVGMLDGIPKSDGPDLVGHVMKRLVDEKHLRAGEKPTLNIDVIGIGSSAYDAARRRDDCIAVAINVGGSPTKKPPGDGPGYKNLRAQMHFEVAEWLTEGAIPPHQLLQADLTVTEYFFDAHGRIQIEDKDQIKARIGRSPNHGDALGLSILAPPPEDTSPTIHVKSSRSLYSRRR